MSAAQRKHARAGAKHSAQLDSGAINVPAAGNFHGCFVEPGACVTGNPLNRKMTFIEWAADMTVGKCRNLAIAKKFRFAGLQFGELCYGSNDVSTYQSEGVCDVACAGSSFEFCGGANCATSIYHTGYNGARQACVLDACDFTEAVELPLTADRRHPRPAAPPPPPPPPPPATPPNLPPLPPPAIVYTGTLTAQPCAQPVQPAWPSAHWQPSALRTPAISKRHP